jgi:hypothetical protein
VEGRDPSLNDDSDAGTIRAVLDTSAIMSYARAHIHVGELLTEIVDENAFVGLPAVALLDALARTVGDESARARIGVLATIPGVVLLELDRPAAEKVANMVPFVDGDLAQAQAVWSALEHDAYYVTAEPDRAPSILNPAAVLAVPEEDA